MNTCMIMHIQKKTRGSEWWYLTLLRGQVQVDSQFCMRVFSSCSLSSIASEFLQARTRPQHNMLLMAKDQFVESGGLKCP